MQSARKNHLEAQLLVGNVLGGVENSKYRPFASVVEKNEAKAVEFWKLSASSPHSSPEAMFRLGRAAFFGVDPSPSTGDFLFSSCFFIFFSDLMSHSIQRAQRTRTSGQASYEVV